MAKKKNKEKMTWVTCEDDLSPQEMAEERQIAAECGVELKIRKSGSYKCGGCGDAHKKEELYFRNEVGICLDCIRLALTKSRDLMQDALNKAAGSGNPH